MKHSKIISVVLVISILLSSFLSCFSAYAVVFDDSNFETLYLTQADYCRTRTVNGKTCYTHIQFYTVNLGENTYEGRFYVTGGDNYSENISGRVSKDPVWNSGENFILNFSISVNWNGGHSYVIDLNDEDGILDGVAPSEGILGFSCKFTGPKQVFKNALKLNKSSFKEALYDRCKEYSVAAYDSEFAGDCPRELYNSLCKDEYTNVVANYFGDLRDNNVSYVIGHKKLIQEMNVLL